MRRPPLTDIAIRSLQPPEKGSRILWDSLPGFGCRISQAGTRAFVYLVESGKPVTLGRYGPGGMTLSEGRAAAKKLAAEKTLNVRRFDAPQTSYDAAVIEYLEECERKNRKGTVDNYRRLLKHFPFGRRSLRDITPREIVRCLNQLADRPSERHHAFVALRAFMRYCRRQHLITVDPTETLAVPNGSKLRERILTRDELKAVWTTARTLKTPFHGILCFVILLGLRRSEAAGLQLDWFNESKRLLTIPGTHTKNKRTLVLPYGNVTADLFTDIEKMVGSPYLFPALRHSKPTTTHFNGFGKPLKRLQQECGVHNWSLHTFRHQLSSGLAELGVNQLICERILNHVVGVQTPIARRYDHFTYLEPMREALTKWETHIAALTRDPA